MNNNIKKSFILNNPNITQNRFSRIPLGPLTFNQNQPIPREMLSKLRVCDITNGRIIKTIEQIRAELNIILSPATHLRLALAIGNLFRNHRPLENSNNTSVKVESYLAMFKKGSKPFQKILDKPVLPTNIVPQTVISFARIANETYLNLHLKT